MCLPEFDYSTNVVPQAGPLSSIALVRHSNSYVNNKFKPALGVFKRWQSEIDEPYHC